MTSFHSPKSIKNFIRFVLSVNPPAYCFHQTLTFQENITDGYAAKPKLKDFLDKMHQRFDMASFYVIERQDRGSVHFHVVFFVYDGSQLSQSPEAATRLMRREAFRRWNNITQGTITQRGQRLSLVPKNERTVSYFFENGKIKPKNPKFPHPRTDPNWWGIRTRKLFEANMREVSNEEVNKTYWELISIPAPARNENLQPTASRTFHNRRTLDAMKAYADAWDKDWDTVKRTMTGSKERVSDSDLIDFLNRKERRKQQRETIGRPANAAEDSDTL